MLRIILILLLVPALEITIAAQSAEPPTSLESTALTEPASTIADEAELIKAVKAGDLTNVLRLLENGIDPNATDEDHSSALCLAVRMNRIDIAEALLARNAKVDPKEDDEGTPLQAAAAMGRADLAKLLIAHGANVNHEDHDGHTVLMCAAFGVVFKGVPDWIAKKLFDVDEEDQEKLSAMGDDHVAVAKLLVEAGANVNTQADDCGMTALMIAAMGGNVELCQILLAHGADVNLASGELTALKLAQMGETTESLQQMLEEEPDSESRQALINWLQISRPGHLAIAELLRKAGAKAEVSTSPRDPLSPDPYQ